MAEKKEKKSTAQTPCTKHSGDCKLKIRTGIRSGSGDDYGFTSCAIK